MLIWEYPTHAAHNNKNKPWHSSIKQGETQVSVLKAGFQISECVQLCVFIVHDPYNSLHFIFIYLNTSTDLKPWKDWLDGKSIKRSLCGSEDMAGCLHRMS